MRHLILLTLVCLLALSSNSQNIFDDNSKTKKAYEIKGEIRGLNDSIVILGYYQADKQYAKDTAIVKKEKFVFSGEDRLKEGMYFVLLSNNRLFDIIITEQKFSFNTSIENMYEQMEFKNSKENPPFYNYINYMSQLKSKTSPLVEKLKSVDNKEKEQLQEELQKINEEVKKFQNTFIKDYSNIFFSKIVKATLQIEVQEVPDSLKNDEKKSINFQRNSYKKIFLDNLDLSDGKMLRTPKYVFYDKIDQFLNQLTIQHPDSINRSADLLIEKTNGNKEIFRYLVSYITSTYERSKIMGMDAVFVHMVEKYYMTNKCDWVDPEQLSKIADRAQKIAPNLLGRTASDFIDFYGRPFMKDVNGKTHTLSDISSEYTVLVFFGPTCGHCKKEMPKIKHNIDSLTNLGYDITTFAVATEFDKEEWKKFIKDQKTEDWINVADINHDEEGNPVASSDWRDKYDIYSTPVVYLLDKNKKILAKRISHSQLVEIISSFGE